MDPTTINKIVSFIWGIADDVLRDLFKRGKYPDVILPMCVIRRPLLEAGGIAAFIQREVLPYTPDAWVKADATKIGYEISFTRHFYKPQPLRTLDAIAADILALEKETGGLLDGLLKGGKS